LFWDEFDSIAGRRIINGRTNEEMVRSVNTLLPLMDGISSGNVFVVGATNLPWSLDPAVLRRFTETVFVDLPDVQAIEFLIRKNLAMQYADPWKTAPKASR